MAPAFGEASTASHGPEANPEWDLLALFLREAADVIGLATDMTIDAAIFVTPVLAILTTCLALAARLGACNIDRLLLPIDEGEAEQHEYSNVKKHDPPRPRRRASRRIYEYTIGATPPDSEPPAAVKRSSRRRTSSGGERAANPPPSPAMSCRSCSDHDGDTDSLDGGGTPVKTPRQTPRALSRAADRDGRSS